MHTFGDLKKEEKGLKVYKVGVITLISGIIWLLFGGIN
jgi:hypothetical protein